MAHLFLLYVLVNGQIQSSDMYFYDINRCNYFATAIVRGKEVLILQTDLKYYKEN